jgi:uncharacterized membrane protein
MILAASQASGSASLLIVVGAIAVTFVMMRWMKVRARRRVARKIDRWQHMNEADVIVELRQQRRRFRKFEVASNWLVGAVFAIWPLLGLLALAVAGKWVIVAAVIVVTVAMAACYWRLRRRRGTNGVGDEVAVLDLTESSRASRSLTEP